MTDKTFKHFYGHCDIVVTGTNPENADYTNPRGERYGFQAYVQVANDFGDTRVKTFGVFHSQREAVDFAEKLAATLQTRLDKLGKYPVGFAAWAEGRAVYGSDAYVAYGQAEEVEWERRMDEDEAWA
jgi:hypothetical protein